MNGATAQLQQLPSIPIAKLSKAASDPEMAARVAKLVYVTDDRPGITRKKRGKAFEYYQGGKKISDTETLVRIKSLVIPPAWQQVWICVRADGHLQATGIDVKGRKQYRYHPLWTALRNQTKFSRLYSFGKALPAMRVQVEKHLALPALPQQKVLAAVVSLMERTNIRVGNESYEKANGSYGITTLKDRHVQVKGSNMQFVFRGKKGVDHNISLASKRLAKIVKQCRDIPGKELFQYYDEEGNRCAIDSGMVNDYIRDVSGGDFTAKDFRTWSGTVQALLALQQLGCADTKQQTQKNIVAALDEVSRLLGNTRTVCKKYYVHPVIIDMYECRALEKFWKQLDRLEKNDGRSGLTKVEQLLMRILKQPK